jgi:hypothetical protein
MAQGMSRRHLFDNGYPVSQGTLIAGSLVLLAVANEALRKSRFRLAMGFLRLSDTSQRVVSTIERQDCSRIELRHSRENYSRLLSHAETSTPATVEEGVGCQPGERPARPQADRR